MILKVLTTEGVYQTFSSKKHNEKIIVKIISELKKEKHNCRKFTAKEYSDQ